MFLETPVVENTARQTFLMLPISCPVFHEWATFCDLLKKMCYINFYWITCKWSHNKLSPKQSTTNPRNHEHHHAPRLSNPLDKFQRQHHSLWCRHSLPHYVPLEVHAGPIARVASLCRLAPANQTKTIACKNKRRRRELRPGREVEISERRAEASVCVAGARKVAPAGQNCVLW